MATPRTLKRKVATRPNAAIVAQQLNARTDRKLRDLHTTVGRLVSREIV